MSLKILLAPNSYKGCADALRAYRAYKEGVYYFSNITSLNVETRKLLVCDGGTGFADIIGNSFPKAKKIEGIFHDPLNREIKTYYYLAGELAIIESAKTIGHALLSKSQLNPLQTTTIGLGEMIKHAIDHGAQKVLIGCGDTATSDCGIGMLYALGVKFYDQNGDEIHSPAGKDLFEIKDVNFSCSSYVSSNIEVDVACNLTSIAAGSSSTALVYSRQKGASEEESKCLFDGITSFTKLVGSKLHEPDLGLLPGSGAAGGVGFGLSSLFKNCRLRYSFDIVFEKIKIDEFLKWADVVITGEGLFDRNSIKGKAPVAVALRAKAHDTMVVGLVGAIQTNITSRILRSGFDILEPFSAESLSVESYCDMFDDITRDATVRALLKLKPLLGAA